MKRIIAAILCATFVFALASCTSDAPVEINIDELCTHIAQNASFSEELEKVDSDFALEYFGLESGQASAALMTATTAVAEKVAVFEATSASDAAIVESAVETKIDELSTSYASYGPAEVPKIESSVVLVTGNYVIFCISADNVQAKQIIDDYLK